MAEFDHSIDPGAAASDAPAADSAGSTDDALSLRDELDAAFEQHASNETEPQGTPDRPRDESGRFTKAAPTVSAPKPVAAQVGAPISQAAPTPVARPVTGAPPRPGEGTIPELKAPNSWKPEAREKWAGVDPLVRTEIHRREAEHQQFMQNAAGLRQFVEAFESTVRPYEMFIRAANSSPLQAVQNLMSTAAQLHVGTPQAKAQIIADVAMQYGVDLKMLDTFLAARVHGTPLAPGAMPVQQQQPMYDPRVDRLLYDMQQNAAYAQQQQQQMIFGEIDSFAQTHEFYNDVSLVMADLIEVAARQGRVLTFEDAYKHACQMDESVAKIMAGRRTTQNAGQMTQAALRAKRAASSLKGDSALHTGSHIPANDSLRAAIETAFETAGQSRV